MICLIFTSCNSQQPPHDEKTWLIKKALNDLVFVEGGTFMIEGKEDAVIAVLDSSRNKVEFDKIVKGVEEANRADRINVDLDDLVDFSQQDKLNYLRNVKFK